MTIDELLARADQKVHGSDFNRVLHETRATLDRAVGYELVLGDRGLEEILMVELPKMTEHFLAKRLPMLGGATAILTLWKGETAYVFSAVRFFDAILELVGIDAAELKKRIGDGRERAGLERDPWRSQMN